MRKLVVVLLSLMLTACAEISEGVQNAQQAIETGKQAVETGKQALEAGQQLVDAGKQLAESELAQQLKTYLQEKYDSSENLRNAMFSGNGTLLQEELQNTELANFSLYRSELFGVEYTGQLTADGTFQIEKVNLNDPSAEPAVVKEFRVNLDTSGQIQVEEQQ
ncbi:hypothetical protein ACAF76_004740 [Brevibacillus sp. TJ4]|uniref:hypothetical protein n=1 Tax=Brevibacillus sp. TJ4 TaxID=3234853 RepID=UPI0037D7B696